MVTVENAKAGTTGVTDLEAVSSKLKAEGVCMYESVGSEPAEGMSEGAGAAAAKRGAGKANVVTRV